MIYTIGYATLTQSKLLAIAELLDATVIDVRSIPRSRKAGFSKTALKELLGEQYEHIPSLGGKPYKPPKRALTALKERQDNVILMCVENNPIECHRHKLALEFEQAYHIFESKLFLATDVQDAYENGTEEIDCLYSEPLEAIFARKDTPSKEPKKPVEKTTKRRLNTRAISRRRD
jgi:predicted HicB family RNase H-like nuclease